MNIWIPLFWSTWSWARGQDSATSGMCRPGTWAVIVAIIKPQSKSAWLSLEVWKKEVCSSFYITTVWEQHPRSHHKRATDANSTGDKGRVTFQTGDQLHQVLCLALANERDISTRLRHCFSLNSRIYWTLFLKITMTHAQGFSSESSLPLFPT